MTCRATCKKCGICCRWVYIQCTNKVSLSNLDSLRGMEIVGDYILRIPVACSLLDLETNLCKDYEHRPEACEIFPEVGIRPKECKYEESKE